MNYLIEFRKRSITKGLSLSGKNLSRAKFLVRAIDASNKQFDIMAYAFSTGDEKYPIIIQTKTVPKEISEGSGTLVLIVNGEAKTKINVSVIQPPLKAETSRLASLVMPTITSVQIGKKNTTFILKISGSNFFDKEIFKEGKLISTSQTQTSFSLLPSSGLELVKYKILKKNKITGENIILALYKVTGTQIPQSITLSVLNPYGQALKAIKIK